MRLISARRIIPACIISAGAVAALAAPGVASASLEPKCTTAVLKGEGSSAQKIAQREVWDPQYESASNSNSLACKGKVTFTQYGAEGSGAGLRAMGAEGEAEMLGASFQFGATDEAPNEKQKNEIEKHSTLGEGHEQLETIPVVQFAVAIIVHLPTGCTATTNGGRLKLTNKKLGEIWDGKVTTWGQIKESGDHVSSPACEAETIQPIVRRDQSGTTHTFKNYLALFPGLGSESQEMETRGAVIKTDPEGWKEVTEGAENTTWPKKAHVIWPAANGGSKVVKLVEETASSIGYANLGDARAGEKHEFLPPASPTNGVFWAEIQNTGSSATKKLKYADPSDNKEAATASNSNCGKEKFTNGTSLENFPPKNTKKEWNHVTTALKEKKYPLCGLTYVMGVDDYSTFTTAPSPAQVTAVHYFYEWIVSESFDGGQPLIQGHDYERLTKGIDTIAKAGAARVMN
jgi:ABC-type phosphate transport system substrate-binding protein